METRTILKIAGIVLVCIGIYFGVHALLPMLVFGSGLALMFLP